MKCSRASSKTRRLCWSVLSKPPGALYQTRCRVCWRSVTDVMGFVKTTGGVAKGIDVLVDCASAVKVLRVEEVASGAAKVLVQEVKAARNLPNVAADIGEIGQLAKGTPLALAKSARMGFIALNSIFMGVDLFFICKDSISLANGGKSDMSKVIRARAALWKTELDSWEKIHRSLCIGIWRFRKSVKVLQKPFCTKPSSKLNCHVLSLVWFLFVFLMFIIISY